jgi:hypothetical protein
MMEARKLKQQCSIHLQAAEAPFRSINGGSFSKPKCTRVVWSKSGAWYVTLNKVFQFKVSAVGPTSSWPWKHFSAMTVYEPCLDCRISR